MKERFIDYIKKSQTISTKLLMGFIMLTVIPMFFVGVWISYNYQKELKENEVAILLQVAQSKEKRINDYFDRFTSEMRILEHDNDLFASINTFNKVISNYGFASVEYHAVEDFYNHKFDFTVNELGYCNFLLVNTQGHVLYSHSEVATLGVNLFTGPYSDSPLADICKTTFKQHDVVISNYHYNTSTGHEACFMSVPISHNEKAIGMLIVELGIEDLISYISDNSDMEEMGDVVLGKLSDGRVYFLSPSRCAKFHNLKDGIPLGADSAFAMQNAVQGKVGYGTSLDLGNVKVIAAWNHIESPNLGLVVKADVEEVYRSANKLKMNLILTLLIILFIALLMTFLLTQSITKPLREILLGVKKVSEGNLDYVVNKHFSGELGELASSFDAMRAKLYRRDLLQNKLYTALNESEQRLNTAILSANLGLWDWNSVTGELYVNPIWKSMLGYEYSDASIAYDYNSFIELVHPDDLDRINMFFDNQIRGVEESRNAIELRMRCANGSYLWVLSTGKVVERDTSGTARRLIGIHTDISERKKQEEDLRKSEFESKAALKLSKSAPFYIDFVNHPDRVYGGEGMFELLGIKGAENLDYKESEWISRNLLATNSDLSKTAIANFHELMRNPDAEFSIEVQFTRETDGKVIWLKAIAEIEHDEHGKPQRLWGVNQDITAFKLSEQMILDNNKIIEDQKVFLESLLFSIPDVVFAKDLKGKYILGNRRFSDIVGGTGAEFKGKTDYDFFSADVADVHRLEDQKVISSESSVTVNEGLVDISGKSSYFETTKTPFRDKNDKLIGLIGISRDVTEQKESALEREKLLAQKKIAEEQARMGSWLIDFTKDPINLVYDENLAAIEGREYVEGENYYSFEYWDQKVSRENEVGINRKAEEAMSDPSVVSWDQTFKFKRIDDNRVIWLRSKALLKRDAQGRPAIAYGSSQDITEQVERDEERTKLLVQQKIAGEQAKMGSWFIDFRKEDVNLVYDENLALIEGHDYVEGQNYYSLEEWGSALASDNEEAASIVYSTQQAIADPNAFSWDQTYSFNRLKDGHVIWVRAKAVLERDSEGRPVMAYGSTQDITEQKQQEEEREKILTQLKIAGEQAKMGSWFVDFRKNPQVVTYDENQAVIGGREYIDGQNFYSVNEWETKLCSENEQGEVIGQKLRDVIAAPDAFSWDETYKMNRVNDNSTIWVRSKAILKRDDQGHAIMAYGSTQDITEQKEREEEREKLLIQQKIAGEQAKMGSWYIDFKKEPVVLWFDQNLARIDGREYIDGQNYLPIESWSQKMAENNDGDISKMAFEKLLDPNVFSWDEIYKIRRINDNEIIWLRSKAVLTRDEAGRPLMAYGSSQDVTEQKEQEEEREKLLIQQRIAGEQAKMGSWYMDFRVAPLSIIYDENLAAINGYEYVEGQNTYLFDDWLSKLACENNSEIVQQVDAFVADPDVFAWDQVYIVLRASDNALIWVRSKAILKRDEDGKALMAYGSTQDITEQIRQDAEREKILIQLKIAGEQAMLGSWYIDYREEPINFTYDENLARIEGLDYVEGSNFYSLESWGVKVSCENNDGFSMAERANEVMANPTVFSWDETYKFNRLNDNRTIWVRSKAILTRDEAGNLLMAYGSTQDITEQKKQEAEREKLLLQQQIASEQAKMGSWYIDFSNKPTRIIFDENLAAIHGQQYVEGENSYLLEDWGAIIHKVDARGMEVVQRVTQIIYDASVFNWDDTYQFLRKNDGQVIWSRSKAIINRDGDGNAVFMYGSTQDVTDQKEVEQELTRLNLLSDNALKLTKSGFWYIDYTNPDYYYPSAEIIDMLGYLPKDSDEYHITDEWFVHLQEADVALAELALQCYVEAVEGSKKFDVIYKYKRPLDGEILWLRSSGEMVRDADGNNLFMYGVKQDVTEQKLAEEEILLSQKRLQTQIRVSEYEIDTIQDFLNYAQDEALKLTQSELGCVCVYDALLDEFTLSSWSKGVIAEGEDVQAEIQRELLEIGLWKEVVRERKAVIVNEHVSHDFLHEGITVRPLKRFMSVPVFLDGEIVAIVGVANKATPYSATDSSQLGLMMDSVWKMVERFETSQKLEKAKAQMEDAAMAANFGMWDWNPITNELYTNDTYETMLGYEVGTFEDTIDKWINLVHPDDVEMVTTLLADKLAGKVDEYRCEYRMRTQAGTWNWVQDVGNVADYNEAGQVVRFLGFQIDIHESKVLQENLEKAKEEAESANVAKSAFLANMSHEIRTPMNAIIGFSEILSRDISEPTQKRHLNSIKTSGRALLGLINDILDISKIEAGSFNVQKEVVSLKVLFTELETIFSLKMEEKGLHFKLTCDPKIPDYLELDELHLRQVLINLFSNACKFTEVGFIELKVEVVPRSQDTVDLRMSVVDTGIGISEDNQLHVFEAFKQVEDQDTRKYGGTGLGLAISTKMVELMGGTLTIDSEVGKGSTFSIDFSNVKVLDGVVTDDVNEYDYVPEQLDFHKATLLLVDDVAENREVIKGYLKGYDKLEIVEAGNGEVAIKLAEELLPDLILMDLRMPVMDGYAATERIRRNPCSAHIPIIAVTASAFITSQQEIKDKGFSAYVRKPFHILEFVNVMASFLKFDLKEVVGDVPVKKGRYDIALSPSQMENLNAIIEDLDLLKTDFWLKIEHTMSARGLKKFNAALSVFNEKYQIAELIHYSATIKSAINSFDIQEMKLLGSQFTRYLDVLKAIAAKV